MRVLLTGARGFLGRYVLERLRRAEAEIIAIGREPVSAPDVKFAACDLLATGDFKSLVATTGATHLIHLAWCAEHGVFWTAPDNLRWADATNRLVKAACEVGLRHVLVAGTCAEYDWSYGRCREDATPARPATLYGAAKDAARSVTMGLCRQHKIACAWGRIFLPYGPGEDARRLIPSLTKVFRGEREPFGVNAAAYRDFLHAVDVAEAFLALAKSEADGVFNIGSGEPVQIAEIVRQLAKFFDADPSIVLALAAERPGEPPLLVGDNRKLRATGWRQTISLAEGLKQAAVA